MSVTGERLDFTLELAARQANLAPVGDPPSLLAAAEADEAVYTAWADTPRPELGGLSPRAYAAGRDLPAVLAYLDDGAPRRGGRPSRLWAEELVRRLNAGDQEVLAALSERAVWEPDSEWEPDYPARTALAVLARWGDPQAIPVLLAALAATTPTIRQTAVDALGGIGTPALAQVRRALETARDDQVRQSLIAVLGRMPRSEAASAALREAWAQAAGAERVALVHATGRYGDPEFVPVIRAEMAAAQNSRTHWAICRVALHRLGAASDIPPPPPPQPGAETEDLYNAAWELHEGGLDALAAEWIQEAIQRLADQEATDPGHVDWYLYEHTHTLADTILGRSPELALRRYLDYCAGALHYYGALFLDDLISAVSVAGSIRPPHPDTLWAALKKDPRFVLHTGRIVSLPAVESVETLLKLRDEVGLGPALIPLSQMALAARGLAHLAWTSNEEEAARELMQLLPAELATPERIAELQVVLRSAPQALDSFRRWVRNALDRGLNPDERMKRALDHLWEHTARWELYGHTPWAAREIFALQEAQEEAPAQLERLRLCRRK